MDKKIAKDNLKIVLDKYNKYKNSDSLEHEANAEKIIEEIFEKVLGWESLEDYIKRKSQDTGKFPDYTFRIEGINKFFLEAKKLDANLDNLSFQKQAIGYARSSAVPFAVLTNFREIRVYVVDREIDNIRNYEKIQLFQPILIEKCLEENEFEKLWLFSKDSFLNKKIYSFAEERCKLTKRKEIGEQLSIKLNSMREKIKTNIKKHEQKNTIILSSNDNKILIEEVVQKLLDRLVFIRVCEDREYENRHLERYINAFEQNKGFKVLESIKELFRDYNIKNEKTGVGGYDSGLFEESLCDSVYLEDDFLVKVIEEFYYFEDGTPINFSKIPADILGNLYENYLSHISRNVETQKSHRKEQGIYYTPTYIVDYIVKNTIGEIIKDKKIDIDKVKILDPSCGSGSFLIKAFDFIDDYHKKKDDYSQKRLADDGTSYSTKERILRNNLFGVDLDTKAVEIAQLNLLLKIAEKGHKLPVLQKNIRRGNSLIDNEEIAPKDYFKWGGDFKEGNFDVVIGNPPWGADMSLKETDYYVSKYGISKKNLNTFELFVRRAISLLKDGGYFGFVIPKNSIKSNDYTSLRKYILENTLVKRLTIFGIFEGVTQEFIVLIFVKSNDKLDAKNKNKIIINDKEKVAQTKFYNNTNHIFNPEIGQLDSLFTRIEIGKRLGESIFIKRGEEISKKGEIMRCYNCNKWFPASKQDKKDCIHCNKSLILSKCERYELVSKSKDTKHNIPIITGEDITPYNIRINHYFDTSKSGIGYKDKEMYLESRILMNKIASTFKVGFIEEEGYCTQNVYSIKFLDGDSKKLKVLLALFNSELLRYYYEKKFNLGAKITTAISLENVRNLNFPELDDRLKEKIVSLVDKLIIYNSKLNEFGDKSTSGTKDWNDKISDIDKEINEEVYKLYGIGEKEQEIIKNNLNPPSKS